jgi:hypothetical protein
MFQESLDFFASMNKKQDSKLNLGGLALDLFKSLDSFLANKQLKGQPTNNKSYAKLASIDYLKF